MLLERLPAYAAVDLSGRALVRADGGDVLDLLQRISTNDLGGLGVGESRPTILLNEKGRILEVLTVSRTAERETLLVAQSSDRARLLSWLRGLVFLEDAAFEDVTDAFVHLFLFSVERSDTHEPDEPERGKSFFHNMIQPLSKNVVQCVMEPLAPGRSLHLIAPPRMKEMLLACLFPIEIPQGKNAYEGWRVTAGIPTPTKELSEDYNPLEAGLSSLIAENKGCFTGQEVVVRIDAYDRLQRKLCKF